MKHAKLICNIMAMIVVGVIGLNSVQGTTWDGGGDNTSWGDGVNWNPDGVPVPNVDDVTISGATLPVNLGGTGRSLQGRVVTFSNSTLTNGTLSFHESGGSMAATNVTFAANSLLIDSVPRNMTFVNSTYADSSQTWSFGNNFNSGGLTINGGSINVQQLILLPAAGSTISKLMIDGSVGFHRFTVTSFGNHPASAGHSDVTVNNASMRISSGGNWGGGAVGSTTTVRLDNATVRLDDGLNLRPNLILQTKKSRFLLNTGATGLNNLMTSASRFDGEGLTIDATTEQNNHPSFEVAGTVPGSGVSLAQFHDNFSVDHLIFGSVDVSHTTPRLILKDNFNNDGLAGAEALFTDKITYSTNLFGNTFTLQTAGLNIYYKKLVTNGKTINITGGGSLIQVTGAKLVSTAPYTWKDGGDAEVAVYGGSTLALASPSDYGTVIITNAPNGGDLFLRLDVSGATGDINSLAADLGAGMLEGDLLLDYSGLADGNNQFFDWSFSYRNVTVNSIFASAIPEPSATALVATGWLLVLWRRKTKS